MKIKIKSYYTYYTNDKDYLEEELDATININNTQIDIMHDEGSIFIEDNKITQVRNNNTMVIEVGKITSCTYHIEYGNIALKIEGISVERFEEGNTICRAAYLISSEGMEPYKVEIEITMNP